MKNTLYIVSILVGLALSACTSGRYAYEHDDVYYSRSDRMAQAQQSRNIQEAQLATRTIDNDYAPSSARRIENHTEEVYGDDDFVYSRRIRRFDEASGAEWRYYDPYFANDIYYVMGTPYWNRWYNAGWYDWNRPRFGWSFNTGFGWGMPYSSFGFGFGFGNAGFSPWGPAYYNPWVSTYYGYSPAFWGYDPFFSGFGTGFYPGYGFGGGGYYCPPVGAFPINTGLPAYRTAYRRQSTSSPTSSGNGRTMTFNRPSTENPRPTSINTERVRSGSNDLRNSATASNASRPASSDNRYLVPRYRTSNVETASGSRIVPVNRSNPALDSRSRSTRNVNRRPSIFRSNTPSSRSRSISPSRNSRNNFSSPSRNSGGSFNRGGSNFSRPSSSGSFNRGSRGGSSVRPRGGGGRPR